MSHAVNEVLYGRLRRLRHTYRYSAQAVIERENVAEHSYWTAVIAMTIAHEVEPNSQRRLAETVAVRGLLHDIEECITGDLVRDLKYATPHIRRIIKNVEEVVVRNLLKPLGKTGEVYQSIWESSKDDTLAGEIVKLADMLCVISYCTQEMELGNRTLGIIKEECISLIKRTISTPELIVIANAAIDHTDETWESQIAR